MSAAMDDRCPTCHRLADCCGNCGCDPDAVDLLGALADSIKRAWAARREDES